MSFSGSVLGAGLLQKVGRILVIRIDWRLDIPDRFCSSELLKYLLNRRLIRLTRNSVFLVLNDLVFYVWILTTDHTKMPRVLMNTYPIYGIMLAYDMPSS